MDRYNKPVLPLALPLTSKNPDAAHAMMPAVSEDFVALIERETDSISVLGLTTEVFVDRVNGTTALRYYFQDLTPEELTALGFCRQGYWLRVRPGCEKFIVSIPKIAAVLRAACMRTLMRHSSDS